MLFHSFAFLYLFSAVYITIAFLIKISDYFQLNLHKKKVYSFFLLLSSYYFYAYWDFRFLFLIVISSLVDYYAGKRIYIANEKRKKKLFLSLSLIINLGILGFFKYFNFFIGSIETLFEGFNAPFSHLNIILPVGISFYTFQSMSYTIDIYRGSLKPTDDFIDFATYVAFFPQLVAGPIVRASHFLPQLSRPIVLTGNNFFKGLQIFLYGLFLKIVIADNVALLVDPVFKNPNLYDGIAVWVAVIGYSIQIFCDFCGYSEMALGIALTMGFKLPVNFRTPYLATDLFDFWRRWHISLSSWLRDYLYISLSGNRRGFARTCGNIFITMLLGGLWHGASWNFILWGAFHGFGLFLNKILSSIGLSFRPLWFFTFSKWLMTYLFVCFGWVLFRSENLNTAWEIYRKMMFFDTRDIYWQFLTLNNLFFIPVMIFIHFWFYKTKKDSFYFDVSSYYSHAQIILTSYLILLFSPMDQKGFIYFQF
ncbi:MAG TPA: MBOAT family O-acyltransferase [Nitrospinota bacterium]|nr:MBOAT family O-acyltransferase [Nitrospinota bacterium]|tara:strand:+ start:988 stop:2424 length:1437 start_codon:yes stop_codon:yes gene_type:complete